MYHYLRLSLLLLSVWASGVGITSPALAEYTPPPGGAPRGSSAANGSRTGGSLVVLAPTGHVGRSTPTPTLSWFVADGRPYQFEVFLFKAEADGTLEQVYRYSSHEEVEVATDMSGRLVRRSLPWTESALEAGQRYFWEVSFDFDPATPQYDQSFVAQMDVVEPSGDLTVALANAESGAERSAIYAKAGYWYDALREAEGAQIGTLVGKLATLEPGTDGKALHEVAESIVP